MIDPSKIGFLVTSLGLSQTEVADVIGIRLPHLSNIIAGRDVPSLDVAVKLDAYLKQVHFQRNGETMPPEVKQIVFNLLYPPPPTFTPDGKMRRGRNTPPIPPGSKIDAPVAPPAETTAASIEKPPEEGSARNLAQPPTEGSAKTFTASGTVTAGLRVTLSGTAVAVAGVSDEDVGVSLGTVADGVPVAIKMCRDGEIASYTANGAITAGVDVYPAASGKVSATIAGKRIGKAIEASTTDGDTIKILKFAPANDRVVITKTFNASSVDDWIFIADRAYTTVSVKEIHSVAGGSAAAAAIRKVTAAGTAAPGASAGATVKELLTAALDLTTTANISQTATLTATTADRDLAAGDKIGSDLSGTLTGLAGCVVVIELKPK